MVKTRTAGIIAAVAFFICALFSLTSIADTITLQQGLNGYSGCTDTFIGTGAYPDNAYQSFGPCSELRVTCSHYASW